MGWRALTVAGSDPSGGAGIQADLRAFAARGVHGSAVITALTVQSAAEVRRVVAVDPDVVEQQMECAVADLLPTVVKTGMLHSAPVVQVVARVMARFPDIPLVVDPVIVSTSGTRLLDDRGVWALQDALLPRADLITPNADEACVLSRMPVRNEEEARHAALAIQALGARAVLVKGGHLKEGPAHDVLFDGTGFHVFEAPRQDLGTTHGTGCALSALIAAEMARGVPLVAAVACAKVLLLEALARGHRTPQGILVPDVTIPPDTEATETGGDPDF